MSKRNLPKGPQGRPAARLQWDVSARALQRWDAGVRAAAEQDRTISVYDVIGYDWWTGEGVTAKRIAAALRSIGPGPVTVNINSPGGDMFEGLAIYNLLREHDGEVTVKVLGLAASAASVIAMAGDTVQIGRAGFLMIHNAWIVAMGNRHDMAELSEWLAPFDAAMAGIYAARSGMGTEDVSALMDAESWIGGEAAIERGLADELLPSDQVSIEEPAAKASAVRRVEAALRASGMPRSEVQRLIHEFKSGLSDSAGSGVREATEHGLSDSAVVLDLLNNFRV